MAPSAGYVGKVYHSTDGTGSGGGAWNEIGHLNAAQTKIMLEMLETTNFKSSGGDKERIAGLRELDVGAIAGDYDQGDTYQEAIRTALIGRTPFWLKILVDGTHGFSCKFIGESFTIKDTVGGKVEFELTVKSTSAPTQI
jgi:predicted secreted protein